MNASRSTAPSRTSRVSTLTVTIPAGSNARRTRSTRSGDVLKMAATIWSGGEDVELGMGGCGGGVGVGGFGPVKVGPGRVPPRRFGSRRARGGVMVPTVEDFNVTG